MSLRDLTTIKSSNLGLGIDAGGSCTRWSLVDTAGREFGRGEGPPLTGHLGQSRDRSENLAKFDQILTAVLESARPVAVVAGITGLHAGTEAADLFRRAALRKLRLQREHVHILNDMDIAYASAFAPGKGVLVYAGTGSVGYHVRADGSSVSVGGHGALVDDAGAAYWIGHEGLKQTLRWADELGRPSDARLAREIYRNLGSTAWPDINERLYENGRSRVASLAPAVHRAAQQGDAVAMNIFAGAGRELARLARLVLERLSEPLPVALAGGTVAAGPLLTQAFAASLTDVPWRVAYLDPVGAAAHLALQFVPSRPSRKAKAGVVPWKS